MIDPRGFKSLSNFKDKDKAKDSKYPLPIQLPNFFSETSYKIITPYNFEDSIRRLEQMSEEDLLKCDHFVNKDFSLDFISEDKFLTNIDGLMILGTKKGNEGETTFYKLVDFEDYMGESRRMDFKVTNDSDRKEISIKLVVDFNKLSENIKDRFCKQSSFPTSNNLVEQAKTNFSNNHKKDKTPELDLFIPLNSIKHIYETEDETVYLFELSHPPKYKSNFLIVPDENNKLSKYENCLFPFRNFDNEVANLKYRTYHLLIKATKPVQQLLDIGEEEEEQASGGNHKGKNDKYKLRQYIEITSLNIERLENLKIVSESEMRKQYGLDCRRELNEFFVNDGSSSYKKLKMLVSHEQLLNSDKEIERQLTVFLYQLCVLVSENILSYFNCIEFMQKIVKEDSYNYFKQVFDTENFSFLALNEALTKLIDYKKNSDVELTVEEFVEDLKKEYSVLKRNIEMHGNQLKAIKKKFLIRSKRVVVTPSYILFVPFIEDQGNRILREYLESPMDAMRCVFKMDNFDEDRWNNKFLLEFIKHFLFEGLKLGNKNFKFFCYSQSQFRSLACWLVISPEEILAKTGEYDKIKIVAKYGARIGQTLTSTIKTLKVSPEWIAEVEPDVTDKEGKYIFSDGVCTITHDLAEKIKEELELEEVPAAYQARFLGCKGVWSVLFDNTSATSVSENSDGIRLQNPSQIRIRESQQKFVKKTSESQYFEVCGYSKFVKTYLNRQIIMLLSALGVSDEVFKGKLSKYRKSLEDEKFIVSLIQYDEWNKTFNQMYLSGLCKTNDRLFRSVVSHCKDILYRDLKSKARIHIDEGAYVMGIMDEFGILEYGEAFLSIKHKDLSLTLNKKCAVTKCPCMHPGDIRLLNFRKYDPDKPETEKYKVFESYKNVIIYPQKGKRPHPNEIAGSDLDGDQYYVFYDQDFCKFVPVEPMDYTDNSVSVKKESISLKDVIEFFAEYNNNNNLGIIANAHLARADLTDAKDEIAMSLAKKFAQAVDAPKTGVVVKLEDNEKPDKFPHYLGKPFAESRRSTHILGQLHDQITLYISQLDKNKNEDNKFCDEELLVPGYQDYIFEALLHYIEYYKEMLKIMKNNDITCESELLTGNNVDESVSIFAKRKHNYDVVERVSMQVKALFGEYKHVLYKSEYFAADTELKNAINKRASAFYYVAYDLFNVINKLLKSGHALAEYKDSFVEAVSKDESGSYDSYNHSCTYSYEAASYGLDFDEIGYVAESYAEEISSRRQQTRHKMEKIRESIEDFVCNTTKNFKIPNNPNDENQYRILSFPWCSAGSILSKIKELQQVC